MGARDAHHVEIVAETARIAPGSSICRVHQCVRSCRAHGLWVWRVAVGCELRLARAGSSL